MRYLGVDIGTKRIGLALSDPTGTIASPLCVLSRRGGKRDWQDILRLAQEHGAEALVVGLPVNLCGQAGLAAENVEAEINGLKASSSLPVFVYDERLTSAAAQRMLQKQGLNSRQSREIIDKVAAAIMLQSFLDRQRSLHESQES